LYDTLTSRIRSLQRMADEKAKYIVLSDDNSQTESDLAAVAARWHEATTLVE
jgi:hypothetical protein